MSFLFCDQLLTTHRKPSSPAKSKKGDIGKSKKPNSKEKSDSDELSTPGNINHSVDDDAELARSLQEEFLREEKQRKLEQQKRDEELAKKLASKTPSSPKSHTEQKNWKQTTLPGKRKQPRRSVKTNTNYAELEQYLEEEYGLDPTNDGSDEDDDWRTNTIGSSSPSDDEADLPRCKYGPDCYRTNPEHLKQFRHD